MTFRVSFDYTVAPYLRLADGVQRPFRDEKLAAAKLRVPEASFDYPYAVGLDSDFLFPTHGVAVCSERAFAWLEGASPDGLEYVATFNPDKGDPVVLFRIDQVVGEPGSAGSTPPRGLFRTKAADPTLYHVHCSDDFRGAFEASGLTGLLFARPRPPRKPGERREEVPPEPITRASIPTMPSTPLNEGLYNLLLNESKGCFPEGLRPMIPARRHFIITLDFQYEIDNGGVYQWASNREPHTLELLEPLVKGYRFFGLNDFADQVQELRVVLERESQMRVDKREGDMATFMSGYDETALEDLRPPVGYHNRKRLAYVRSHPEEFVDE